MIEKIMIRAHVHTFSHAIKFLFQNFKITVFNVTNINKT